MKNIIGALTLLIILFPTLLLSLQRGHINLNGLFLDLTEVVMETFIRRDINLNPTESYPPPNPEGGE